jgi:hypothetical protein
MCFGKLPWTSQDTCLCMSQVAHKGRSLQPLGFPSLNIHGSSETLLKSPWFVVNREANLVDSPSCQLDRLGKIYLYQIVVWPCLWSIFLIEKPSPLWAAPSLGRWACAKLNFEPGRKPSNGTFTVVSTSSCHLESLLQAPALNFCLVFPSWWTVCNL